MFRRLLFALAMSSSIGAIVFGAAAVGLFNTGIIIAGGGPVGISQASPVRVSYDKQAFDEDIYIFSVTFTEIPSQVADGNHQGEILFIDPNGNTLGFDKFSIPAGATGVTHSLSTPVRAEDVSAVKVALNPAQ